jgi:AcrR family transcriptional regulator
MADARERILDAALAEFGAHGYAGARTAGIAARAGVNQQLISYYFGGKRGLLDELLRQWAETSSRMASGGTFAESIGACLDGTLDRPDWARLVVRQALGDNASGDAEAEERVAGDVERFRAWQDGGEVTGRVDAGFAALVACAVIYAPITMPRFVRDVVGGDPLSAEVRERLRDQLVALLGVD